MSLPNITEASIRSNSTAQSFERGQTYYKQGCVSTLTLRGNTLLAEVEGSEVNSYCVALRFDQGGFSSVQCSCPYDFEGWCKHIIATMLVCLHEPDRIEERPTLEQLLDRLDHLQTQRLVQSLVEEHPELIEAVDRHVSLMTSPKPKKQPVKPPRRTTVDPAPVRRQVRQILRDAVRYMEEGYEDDPITEEIISLIQHAQQLTAQDESHNALVILEAITTGCIENWDDVEEYGAECVDIVEALNDAWAEAILCADLTEEERVDLRVNLEVWQDEWNTDFAMCLVALHQGWDYPPLQRVLAGNVTEGGAWEGIIPHFGDDLAKIRLQILERQERYQEYLYLAEAEGQTKHYLTMLGRLGRVEEATGAAKTQMSSAEEAFALAQTLREQGALQPALEVAQTGLSLSGRCRYELADWTSNLAEGLGDRQAALNARAIAFQANPSFVDYRLVEELAGEAWTTLKVDLLESLKNNSSWRISNTKVDIFLHEGLIDDAIATVNDLDSYHSALIHRVMKVAIAHNPDWVIENAIPRADSILDRGKAEYYQEAVEWLKQARAAYLELGRQQDWLAYRNNLIQIHGKKRKFMGLMKEKGLD
ncbi:MAG: SWIM zinc finger domain-containing protein [Microcoleus vaginatus WJT46-NPBG5]|jgi:uncharacterized Zn finger protein|nr:SWIM zinc finger domain-containing protein [Microcoleus vaginatus WJT46-NPBG5]